MSGVAVQGKGVTGLHCAGWGFASAGLEDRASEGKWVQGKGRDLMAGKGCSVKGMET